MQALLITHECLCAHIRCVCSSHVMSQSTIQLFQPWNCFLICWIFRKRKMTETLTHIWSGLIQRYMYVHVCTCMDLSTLIYSTLCCHTSSPLTWHNQLPHYMVHCNIMHGIFLWGIVFYTQYSTTTISEWQIYLQLSLPFYCRDLPATQELSSDPAPEYHVS